MARLYKPTITRYANLNGKRCQKGDPGARKKRMKSKVWRGEFRDAEGILRTESLCTNKEAARQLLAELERKAQHERAGLTSPFEKHHKQLLSSHLQDFVATLGNGDDASEHVSRRSRSPVGSHLLEDDGPQDRRALRVHARGGNSAVRFSQEQGTTVGSCYPGIVSNRRRRQLPATCHGQGRGTTPDIGRAENSDTNITNCCKPARRGSVRFAQVQRRSGTPSRLGKRRDRHGSGDVADLFHQSSVPR